MLKQKAYTYYLAFLVLLLIACAIFHFTELTFVFNIVDTYYVVLYSHITIFMSLIIVVLGLIYWILHLCNIKLVRSLSKIHTTTTIIGLLIFLIVLCFSEFISPIGTSSRFPLFDGIQNFEIILFWLLIIVLLAQLVFIVNIVMSLVKSFKKKINAN